MLQCMHLLYVTHISHRELLATWLYPPQPPTIYSSLGPASHRRAVVVGRYSLHSLEIRLNSGNHFQLPSSDYFGTAACHCEMGLGVRVAGKKKKKSKKVPITALGCLLAAGMSQDAEPQGEETNAVCQLLQSFFPKTRLSGGAFEKQPENP